MRKAIIMLMALALVLAATSVLASSKDQQMQNKVDPFSGRADYTETEPNDDCDNANAPFAAGDSYAGEIVTADKDWFAFTAEADQCVIFETMPQPDQGNMDTKLFIYADDCTTELAFDDDGGPSLFSRIEYTFADAGTYYVVVTGYSDNSTGFYVLTATACPPPPEVLEGSETCFDGVCLVPATDRSVLGDTTDNIDDYDPSDPGPSCTGYGAAGPDVVYEVALSDGATLTAAVDAYSGYIDLAIYLVTDCDDMTTCVAGDDGGNPETITYTHTGETTLYYLIIDGYSVNAFGEYILTYTHDGANCDDPVATEEATWSGLKALYR